MANEGDNLLGQKYWGFLSVCGFHNPPLVNCKQGQALEFHPFNWQDLPDDSLPISGYEVDLLTRVAHHIRVDWLNFSCLEAPSDIRPRDFISLQKNVPEDVLSGIPPEGCDVFIGGLGLTKQLLAFGEEHEYSYSDWVSTSVFSAGFRILVPTNPAPLPPIDMWVFLYAFKWSVWFAILAICIFVALAAWGVEAALSAHGGRESAGSEATAAAPGVANRQPAGQVLRSASSSQLSRAKGSGVSAGSSSPTVRDDQANKASSFSGSTGSQAAGSNGVPSITIRGKAKAAWNFMSGKKVKNTFKAVNRNLFASLSQPVGGRGDLDTHTFPGNLLVLAFGFTIFILMSLYTANTGSLLTTENLRRNIASVRDLQGKTVGTWADPMYSASLGKYAVNAQTVNVSADWNITDFNNTDCSQPCMLSMGAALQQLKEGKIDALVLDNYVADAIASLDCTVKVAGDVFDKYEIVWVFQPSKWLLEADLELALLPRLNQALQQFQEAGAYSVLWADNQVNMPPEFSASCPLEIDHDDGLLYRIRFRDLKGLWILLAASIGIAILFALTCCCLERRKARGVERLDDQASQHELGSQDGGDGSPSACCPDSVTSDSFALRVAIENMNEKLQKQEDSLEERMQKQEGMLLRLLRQTKARQTVQLLPGLQGSRKGTKSSPQTIGSLSYSPTGKLYTDDEGASEVDMEDLEDGADPEAGTTASAAGSPVCQPSPARSLPSTPAPTRQPTATLQRSPVTPQPPAVLLGPAEQQLQGPAQQLTPGRSGAHAQFSRQQGSTGTDGGGSSSTSIPQRSPWR